MSSKLPTAQANGEETPKRQRKVMTLHDKVQLLDMINEGKSYAAVGRHFGVNESTVRYIKKNEHAIRVSVDTNFCGSAKMAKSVRNKSIVKMESALALWIESLRNRSIPLDKKIIQRKALKLYSQFTRRQSGASTAADDGEFRASNGWFDRFVKRYQLRFGKAHGEAASADTEVAAKYPEAFKKLVEEKGYKPEQVFNMDETGLFWKKLPSRTCLMKDELNAPGFKAQKDRVTLIMCGNAAGWMIKPGLIYKSAKPRALKHKNLNTLPVFWMHNSKAWITKLLVTNWFHQCFIPQVEEYLHKQELEFRVLLIMDNAGGHPVDLYHERVQIEFLPPNTTSLLQPMDQGVIHAFKALYTGNCLQQLVDEIDESEDFQLKVYWRNFTIASCLKLIHKALQDMKKETLNACWKNLWPEIVHDYNGFSPDKIQHNAVNRSVELAKSIGGEGFDDITYEDINDLIDAHSQPLTDEDLTELTKSASEEETMDQENLSGEDEDEGLTLERLAELISKAKNLQETAKSWDPYMVRSLQFSNAIDSAMLTYRNSFVTMKKQQGQLPITMFLKKLPKTSDQGTPDGNTTLASGCPKETTQSLHLAEEMDLFPSSA